MLQGVMGMGMAGGMGFMVDSWEKVGKMGEVGVLEIFSFFIYFVIFRGFGAR